MDRLSAYAQREAETVTPEQRQKNEEEATEKLFERLKISKDTESKPTPEHANGDAGDASDAASQATTVVDADAGNDADSNAGNEADSNADKRVRGIPDDIKLFEIFNEQVQSLVKLQRLPLWDAIALMVSLANLALYVAILAFRIYVLILSRNIYPEQLDYVDQVLAFGKEKVSQHANSADLHSQASQSNILSLLLAPIKAYFSMFTALALPNFIPLLHAQPYPTRRAVAGEIARNLLQNQIKIDSEDGLKAILEVLRVIIKEGTQQTSGYPGGPLQRKGAETEETVEEQGWLARIVHLLQAESNDTQFKVSINCYIMRPILTNVAPANRTKGVWRRFRTYKIHIPASDNSRSQIGSTIQSAGTF
jgi:vacuolar protein sorting-associated protein 35